jgi:hypothetical protein
MPAGGAHDAPAPMEGDVLMATRSPSLPAAWLAADALTVRPDRTEGLGAAVAEESGRRSESGLP